jgi:DNA polymerase I-like protein with 3'-5' exonuclease and polymerase domains
VDKTLYASPMEIQAEIDAGDDPHTKAARALFGHQDVTWDERWWAKALNMGAIVGLSPYGIADYIRQPLDRVLEMRERYRQTVLAA